MLHLCMAAAEASPPQVGSLIFITSAKSFITAQKRRTEIVLLHVSMEENV